MNLLTPLCRCSQGAKPVPTHVAKPTPAESIGCDHRSRRQNILKGSLMGRVARPRAMAARVGKPFELLHNRRGLEVPGHFELKARRLGEIVQGKERARLRAGYGNSFSCARTSRTPRRNKVRGRSCFPRALRGSSVSFQPRVAAVWLVRARLLQRLGGGVRGQPPGFESPPHL